MIHVLLRSIVVTGALIAAAPVAPVAPEVLGAARPIARGAVIAPADVALAPAHGLLLGALIDADQAVGRTARRAIAMGVPLRSDAFQVAALVHRGDPVTLRIERAGFSVEARGTAVADAGQGDGVSAVNISTGTRLRGALGEDGVLLVDPLKSRVARP